MVLSFLNGVISFFIVVFNLISLSVFIFPGEQWDWPNVWAPFQHMLIVGLDNLEDDRTKRIAQDWAQRWVQGNYLAYKETGAMFEKVSCDGLAHSALLMFRIFSTLRQNSEDTAAVASMKCKRASAGRTAHFSIFSIAMARL